jgi:hypothetical protein
MVSSYRIALEGTKRISGPSSSSPYRCYLFPAHRDTGVKVTSPGRFLLIDGSTLHSREARDAALLRELLELPSASHWLVTKMAEAVVRFYAELREHGDQPHCTP